MTERQAGVATRSAAGLEGIRSARSSIAVVVIFALWLVLAPWPAGFEDVFGKKRLFINALFNGITLGGLYFLVATGFTLIFGLMRNVNLAHGSLYLFGGYVGYEAGELTGSWLLSYVVAFVVCAIVGMAMQFFIFRRMEGQDLRQTLVTLGLSIVFSDLMVWVWGGNAIQIDTPDYLMGPIPTPIVLGVKSGGDTVFLQYPRVRLVIFAASVIIGIAHVARAQPHPDRRDGPRRRRRPRHAVGPRLPGAASVRAGVRVRRRTCGHGRHRRRHVSVDLARRGLRIFCWRRCRWSSSAGWDQYPAQPSARSSSAAPNSSAWFISRTTPRFSPF